MYLCFLYIFPVGHSITQFREIFTHRFIVILIYRLRDVDVEHIQPWLHDHCQRRSNFSCVTKEQWGSVKKIVDEYKFEYKVSKDKTNSSYCHKKAQTPWHCSTRIPRLYIQLLLGESNQP